MKDIFIQYQTSVTVLPGKVLDVLDRASGDDIKVLIVLCGNESLCHGCDADNWISLVAERAGCDTDAVTSALAFWRGAGVLTATAKSRNGKKPTSDVVEVPQPVVVVPQPTPTQASQPTEQTNTKVKPQRNPELPRYTTEELSNLLESRKETQALITECQKVWGKVFNTHEVNIILGLVDYLGLEPDYVLSLLAYYATEQNGGLKKSLRNVEKKAFDLYDRDIQTLQALHAEIARMEQLKDAESHLRTLFGMGARALTPREKKCFSTWLYDFGYDMEIIRMAYDVTVDAKGAPNINYMNSVLSNWHKDGLRTPTDVQTAQENHKQSQKRKGQGSGEGHSGSFDTDDFFSAAVRRSFGDGFDES